VSDVSNLDEGTSLEVHGPLGRLSTRPGPSRWLALPILTYLGLRIGLLVMNAVIDVPMHLSLIAQLHRWDSWWFLDAAQNGWPKHLVVVDGRAGASTIAFFPVLPIAMRWGAALTGFSPFGVGVVISGITGLTATIAVGLLVRSYADERRARRATMFFVLFPATWVFSLIYAEGIVITATALGLLALTKRRWLVAGLLGALATLTAPVALCFTVSALWCSVQAIRTERSWRSLVAPVLAPLGFVSYMLWLWGHTGRLDAWRVTERGGWKSIPSMTFTPHTIWAFVSGPIAQNKTTDLLVIGIVVAAIGLVLAYREPQPRPVFIYGLSVVLLALISEPVGLRPRFLMLAFPVVLAIGTRLRGWTYPVTLSISGALLVGTCSFELHSWAVFP
jgi:hypothetical protein